MKTDLFITMESQPFELLAELDWHEIDKNIAVSEGGRDIIVSSVDADYEAMEWKFYLSPRFILTALINALATYPQSICLAINEQKSDMSYTLSNAIGEILSRDSYYPEAWEPVCFDFQMKIARYEYAQFFQRCGDFMLDQLRWKITQTRIEIRDCVVCELFETFPEWRKNYHGSTDNFGEDDEDYDLYLEELEEGTWSINYVPLTIRITYAALIKIIVVRGSRGFAWNEKIEDNSSTQQWFDIFVTLITAASRLPNKLPKNYVIQSRAEIIPLLKRPGLRHWPRLDKRLIKFKKPFPRKYMGSDPAW
jgi:hypothetical protein